MLTTAAGCNACRFGWNGIGDCSSAICDTSMALGTMHSVALSGSGSQPRLDACHGVKMDCATGGQVSAMHGYNTPQTLSILEMFRFSTLSSCSWTSRCVSAARISARKATATY